MIFLTILIINFGIKITLLKAQIQSSNNLLKNVNEGNIKIENKVDIVDLLSIKKYNFNGRHVYKCNGRYFNTFYQVYSYASILLKHSIINPPPLNTNPYSNFNIQSYINSRGKSYYIWRAVWNGCSYECFSQKNYGIFKEKIFKEINFLRRYHGCNPLVSNGYLTRLAQKHANKMAKLGKLVSLAKFSPFGEVYGAMFYLAGNAIVNKWYDENRFYDFKNHTPTKKSKMFIQLIWKNTKQIGIGVVRKGDSIFVVCRFYPKANGKRHLKKNVPPPLKIIHKN